jgi:hypothetical protein
MFLQLFETFYDSLADCKILQSNLEDQDRRSGHLLTLLQQSSGMFEKMLEDRLVTIQKDFTRDMQVLEGRIERLEERSAASGRSTNGDSNALDKERTSTKQKRNSISINKVSEKRGDCLCKTFVSLSLSLSLFLETDTFLFAFFLTAARRRSHCQTVSQQDFRICDR